MWAFIDGILTVVALAGSAYLVTQIDLTPVNTVVLLVVCISGMILVAMNLRTQQTER